MSRKGNDLLGKKFGMLTAVELTTQRVNGERIWLFHCDCGNKNYLGRSSEVNSGRTYNCGCVDRTTHGMTGTRTYHKWSTMLKRCNNANSSEFHNYGGRGISVCKKWRTFQGFFDDMGECPPSLTLERIDVNKNYFASNCKWASWEEQANNRRNTRRFTVNGETLGLAQIARKYGYTYSCLRRRLDRGYTIEQAIDDSALERKPYPRQKL